MTVGTVKWFNADKD
jgi:CspA family cold shock protein